MYTSKWWVIIDLDGDFLYHIRNKTIILINAGILKNDVEMKLAKP